MEAMLADGNVIEKIMELKAKDSDLVAKIKQFFDNLLAKIRNVYKGLTPDSAEGKAVLEMKDSIEKIQQLFAEALVEASDNFQSAEVQKNTDTKIGVRHSTKTQEAKVDKAITSDMPDSERATILRSKMLVAPVYEGQADALIEDEQRNLESGQDKLVKAALVRIGEEFKVFANYEIKDVDVKITLSRGNLRESVSKKATPAQIAKLLPVLKNAVEKSIGVESHKNRYFYDNTTISFDNLIGGYVDGEYFVPVRFGLKHIRGGEVTLYVVIDQQKIKAEVLKPITQTSGSTGSRSAYSISIAQIISFVNSKDLLRYLPDDMLTKTQKAAKREGIAETIRYTDNKNDEKYRKFVDAGNMQAAKMMVDAAAKAAGYTIKAYHGTTNRQEKSTWNQNTKSWDTEYSRITVFKRQYPEQAGHFFNSDMDNAGGYGSDLYAVYLMLRKPLVIDCKGQNYSNIAYNGKEMDTYEWAAYAKKQRYDGVVFENISDGVGYDDLSKLTTDYVVFDSNRIKSAETVVYDNNDNVIPVSQRFNPRSNDIRYSDRDYSYEALASKPDMMVTTVDGNVPNNRADVVAQAKQNAAKVGKFDPKTGSVSVYVDDVGSDVVLATNGLKHSLDRRFAVNAPVLLKAGEILQKSIRINEMTPKKADASESYILIGAARNESGDIYIVRSVINRFSNELVSMDVLYAINAKKEPAALLPRLAENSAIRTDSKGNQPRSMRPRFQGPVTDSAISIADLLDLVNQYFPDILPEDVLKHYGYDARPDGDLGSDALYQDRADESVSNRSLLANALEGLAQNDIEKQKIQEYKEKIDLVNAEEKKLQELNAQIKELSFATTTPRLCCNQNAISQKAPPAGGAFLSFINKMIIDKR